MVARTANAAASTGHRNFQTGASGVCGCNRTPGAAFSAERRQAKLDSRDTLPDSCFGFLKKEINVFGELRGGMVIQKTQADKVGSSIGYCTWLGNEANTKVGGRSENS